MSTIRRLYLYSLSFIGIAMLASGLYIVVDLGLKSTLFPKAELAEHGFYYTAAERTNHEEKAKEEARMREQISADHQRELSRALSLFLIGVPLWLYHWKRIKLDVKDTPV
jgi:hypothetical protein